MYTHRVPSIWLLSVCRLYTVLSTEPATLSTEPATSKLLVIFLLFNISTYRLWVIMYFLMKFKQTYFGFSKMMWHAPKGALKLLFNKTCFKNSSTFCAQKHIKKMFLFLQIILYLSVVGIPDLFNWHQLPGINYEPLQRGHLPFIVVISWENEW